MYLQGHRVVLNIFGLEINWNCNFEGFLHHPFWHRLVSAVLGHMFSTIFKNYFLLRRTTDEGSVPEMRIWSILLIKSDLKWCIHLGRSLFSYYTTFLMRMQYFRTVEEDGTRLIALYIITWSEFHRLMRLTIFEPVKVKISMLLTLVCLQDLILNKVFNLMQIFKAVW